MGASLSAAGIGLVVTSLTLSVLDQAINRVCAQLAGLATIALYSAFHAKGSPGVRHLCFRSGALCYRRGNSTSTTAASASVPGLD